MASWVPIYQFGTGSGGGGSGVPGPRGQDANVWLSGNGPPARTLGRERDLYFQQDSGQVYQKLSPFFGFPPTWSVIATLPAAGPMGPAGVPGAAGPAGTPGTIGPRGVDGTNGTNGNSGFVGGPLLCLPAGVVLNVSTTFTWNNFAFLQPVNVPGTMLLDKLGLPTHTTGAGTIQWGLFDYSSNPAAATKLAGGTGSLTGPGYSTIAASGAPVTIQPGNYALITLGPGSSGPVCFSVPAPQTDNFALPVCKSILSGYVWSNTPDLTSTWTNNIGSVAVVLHGRLSSGAAW